MNHLQSDIHYIGIRKSLLFAYQRAVRGYDDRIVQGWGFVDYLDVLLEPLKEFCKGELKEINIIIKETGLPHNSTRENVFVETIKLIDEYRALDVNTFEEIDKEKELWTYIGAHAGVYWS